MVEVAGFESVLSKAIDTHIGTGQRHWPVPRRWS